MGTLKNIQRRLNEVISLSGWMEITQDRIQTFASCSEDKQWIHVDEKRAKKGPFKSTVAHGFLILSLLPYFLSQNNSLENQIKMSVNYGLNRVRFITPVKKGQRIRNRAVLKEVEKRAWKQYLLTVENTIEIEGQDKPAVFAEMVILIFT